MGTTTAAVATVCERFQLTAASRGSETALRDDAGRTWTWAQYAQEVRGAAAGLAGLGLGRGDVLACWLSNRPEFHVADAAAMHLGMTAFSVYDSATAQQAERIIGDAGARVIVTDATRVEMAIAARESGRTSLEHIVCIAGDAPEALGWDELFELAPGEFDFESAWRAVTPDDPVTLIYTSTPAGPPTGVELTHANTVAQVLALTERLRLPHHARAVSFLPMAHVVERLCSHYFPMFGGGEVRCCGDARRAGEAIRASRPTYLFSPPRLWDSLRQSVGADAGAEERAATDAAMRCVRDGAGIQDGGWQRAARARVGLDELQVGVVGTASCPEDLVVFWHALGVSLTELLGRLDADGHLGIADASDGMIVNASGERMSATAIETALTADAALIGQAWVIGDGRPFNVALLTLEPGAARRFAHELGLGGDLPGLARTSIALAAVRAEVAAANRRLERGEQVMRFLLIDGAEGTLDRGTIAARYAREIEALYDGIAGRDVTRPTREARKLSTLVDTPSAVGGDAW